jgi:hypothetical protein
MICPAGTYNAGASGSCLACPAGKYSNPGSSACTSCASYTSSTTSGAIDCIPACPTLSQLTSVYVWVFACDLRYGGAACGGCTTTHAVHLDCRAPMLHSPPRTTKSIGSGTTPTSAVASTSQGLVIASCRDNSTLCVSLGWACSLGLAR